jgi:hypothetical protein
MKNILKMILVLIVVAGLFWIAVFLNQTRVVENVVAPENKEWGVYTGGTASSFAGFENQVGKKANMQAVFIGWYEKFPGDMALPLKSNGQTLVIFWEQYDVTLDEIISGSTDSYIKQFADDAESYGGQVVLAPFHEMNGDWNPWSGASPGNSPEKVVEAWKHIRGLFPINNTNIKWAWVVNNDSSPNTADNQIDRYYPGDNYTDYVGVDGFNFGDPWQTYSEIFSTPLNNLKTYNKPIYIFSIASAEGPKKATWISDALSHIKKDPDIRGFIWFNENKEKNWLVNSDSLSLDAFRRGIE